MQSLNLLESALHGDMPCNKMSCSCHCIICLSVLQEPLRVAMANHLRSLLQALNITGEVLEQAVLLVTNDNLDLGCAVIEKSATDKV